MTYNLWFDSLYDWLLIMGCYGYFWKNEYTLNWMVIFIVWLFNMGQYGNLYASVVQNGSLLMYVMGYCGYFNIIHWVVVVISKWVIAHVYNGLFWSLM